MRAAENQAKELFTSSSRRDFLITGASLFGAGLAGCSGGGTYVAANGSSGTSASQIFATPTPSGPSMPATVAITRNQTTGAVASRMAGLSYEKTKISGNTFTPLNIALISLFIKLGPSVLRIGGNSVDSTTWTSNGAGGIAGQVAPSDVQSLAEFLVLTGWKVIYGINLATNTSALAAEEALFAVNAFGTSLYSFEIGNEPDGYASNGLRPTSYTEADFVVEWSSFASAIRQSVPGAPLSGPAAGYQVTQYTIPFAASQGSEINLLTEHYYIGDGKSAAATMALMLADNTYLQKLGGELKGATTSNNIAGYRFSECNSFYGGGAAGVSNAYGSALWAIDFMLESSQLGSSGVNFHGGGDGTYNPYYTPISDVDGKVIAVNPVFYGMLFTSKIAPGPIYQTALTTTLLMTAYAIAGNDGATYLVLVNKDPANAAGTTVNLGASASRASVLLLTGASLASTTGMMLGGASIGIDGSWTPNAETTFAIRESSLEISVPAFSAVLLKIT